MASADVTKVLRVPGRIAKAPTNLATAFPHGGTALGAVRQVALHISYPQRRIVAEEFQETVETIRGGPRCFLDVRFRQWDADLLATVFPVTSAGASGNKVMSGPGSARAGALGSDSAVKIIFTPDDQGATNVHPAILIYRAIPVFAEEVEMSFSILRELTLHVIFEGIRDASNRIWQIGTLSDLTVS